MSRPADHERAIAQLITGSIKGRRWRDLTPLDVSRHLVANGVRYVEGDTIRIRWGDTYSVVQVTTEPDTYDDGATVLVVKEVK